MDIFLSAKIKTADYTYTQHAKMIFNNAECQRNARAAVRDYSLWINIQRMKLQLMYCAVLERPVLLHHDPEQVKEQSITFEFYQNK